MLVAQSCLALCDLPWTVACQASLSMKFSRQKYWSGLPFSSPRGLPNPGIEPGSPALQADSLPSEPPGKPIIIESKLTMVLSALRAPGCFFFFLIFIYLFCGIGSQLRHMGSFIAMCGLLSSCSSCT